jgi:HPt (histidine-containing phosphotransfer) domain-containing protein
MFRCSMDDKLTKVALFDELKASAELTSKRASVDPTPLGSGSDLAVCDEIQWNELLELDDSDEFVTEIVQAFLEQAEQLTNRLPGLVNDPEVLALEAHKLKGAAGYVGAKRAAYVCGLVEEAAKSHPSRIDQKAASDLKNVLAVSVEDYRKRLT